MYFSNRGYFWSIYHNFKIGPNEGMGFWATPLKVGNISYSYENHFIYRNNTFIKFRVTYIYKKFDVVTEARALVKILLDQLFFS